MASAGPHRLRKIRQSYFIDGKHLNARSVHWIVDGHVERPLTSRDLRVLDLTRAHLDMVERLSQLPAALTSGGMASRTTALATR